ncbi:hypothetical protein V6N11_008096 [Hibiscus sabdariffa]|uniref:PB1-like domain-containing protein n=1 Tax=Hibiscus sabdariffa TaxID=183260 RepID=A0ABR2PZM5_9ROSI
MVGWRRRKQGEKRPIYVHGSSNFTYVIHYGGDFAMSPRMKYTSKHVANFDFVDVDRFSTFTLCEMVEKLVVDVPFAIYWRVPNAALSTASVRPLKTDHDCIAMINSLPDNRRKKNDDIAASEEEGDVVANEEEVNDATTEEEGDVVATEEEEEGDIATEEEADVVEEEEYSEATEEFDVSDHEYNWTRDEECRQEDVIGFKVQRNMDGFGPDGVNVNEKDKEPESETDNSEDLYSDHGSDSDRPRALKTKENPSDCEGTVRSESIRPGSSLLNIEDRVLLIDQGPDDH